MKRKCRQNPIYLESESQSKRQRQFGTTIDDCIEIFHRQVAQGPIYIYCCFPTWFKDSVTDIRSFLNSSKYGELATKCTQSESSREEHIWICTTCKNAIKVQFPQKPADLELHQLEERLITLRIRFMEIRELPRGGQLSIKGNIVNVPCDIGTTIHSLPRCLNDCETITVQLKKREVTKVILWKILGQKNFCLLYIV